VKKHSPKKIAAVVSKTLQNLAKAAKKHHRTSSAMKRAVETALTKLGGAGIEGIAATDLIGAVCTGQAAACSKCGAVGRVMSIGVCVDCQILEARADRSRQFS
jgi:hypothetical protein